MKTVRFICCTVLALVLMPLSAHAQAVSQIMGQVTDQAGQPVAGVLVAVQNTRLTAVTADNGRYAIRNVPAGQQTVTTSILGYAPQSRQINVTAGTPALLDMQLEVQAVSLSQVVVVGYGEQRAGQVTGAVASVKSEDFNQGPARDAAQLIAGKVTGLAVATPSGNPGAGSQIMLRGRTTVQGPTQPLILVDGVPGGLNTVAPEDIDQVTVLKDGSAAAVYGSRASNGVILITTKRHAGGAPTLRYDGYISQSTIYNRPEFLSADDMRARIAEGYAFDCATVTTCTNGDMGFGTDWVDEMLRNPLSYRHNFTLSGGATNTNYTASVNLEQEEGIFVRSHNRELTARANIRHQMFDGKLEAEATLLNRIASGPNGIDYNYAWRQALIRNPTDRISDDNGAWQERSGYFYTNPVGLVQEVNGEFENRSTRMTGTVTFRPINQLRFALMGHTTRSNNLSGSALTFRHPNVVSGSSPGGSASRGTSSGEDRIVELTGTFSDRFLDHSVTLLGGYSYSDFLDEDFSASNNRFPTDLFGWDALERGAGLGQGLASVNSGKSSSKLIGFFSRLNYDYNNKYLLMASARYEGNSVFGADHKWGLFPAVSAGWRISEESFADALPFDDLRLRAGWGITGIAPGNPYQSLTSYSYGARMFYNGQWVQGLGPSRNPNPNLRWEEKSEINVGLNFAAMDFRLTGALDVYRRDTKDMLYNYSVPVPPNLTSSFLANVGTMRNDGIEAEIGYDVIRRDNVTWNTSANWSYNRNVLQSLSNDVYVANDCSFQGGTGEPIQQSTHRMCVGEPLGNFYGYKSVDIDDNGIWIVEDSAGNNININQATARDRHILGNGLPKQYFAWNNQAQIHNFDVSVNMRGAADFQILNYYRMYYENPKIRQYNMLQSAFEPIYGKTRADGTPILLNHDLSYVSYYIEDGDYVKLDNVTLGYTFGEASLGRVSNVLSGARVYVSGRNLLTITGYKGMDPEVPISGLTPGQESRDTYPTVRRFTAGVTFNF